jgi:hypothetical protein
MGRKSETVRRTKNQGEQHETFCDATRSALLYTRAR